MNKIADSVLETVGRALAGTPHARARPAVRLVPASPHLEAALHRLRVYRHQEPFVVDFTEWMRRLEQTPPDQRFKIPLAIIATDDGSEPSGVLVGYIVACPFHEAVAYYCKDESEVGIESLLIDRRYQRKGYGAAAMVATVNHIRDSFPEARQVKFTVNTRNRTAIKLYKRLGFQDTGEVYLAGRSGPQHIFALSLEDAELRTGRQRAGTRDYRHGLAGRVDLRRH